MRCAACNRLGCDPAHIITYAASRKDSPENIMPLCRAHHTMQHTIGWLRFTERFPQVGQALFVRGWHLTDKGKFIRISE
jgi:cephalosporin hydroxylase